jgi:phage tail sheath gpL-like
VADIPIAGVPSTYRTPGSYFQILPAQGPATAAAGERYPVFVMPMTAAGTWTAGILYEVKNEGEAETGGGAGSPIHRAIRRFLKANTRSKVFAKPIAETSGGVPVAADLDVTWTTDPTAQGVTSLWVCGEEMQEGFDDTDTVTTIAARMVLKVNARLHLPVTATSALGVLTLEAKLKGASQGDGTTGVIRVHASIDQGVGTTVATENGGVTDALGLGTATAGVDGTTTEAANLSTALGELEVVWHYYKAISAIDSVSLGHLSLHIATVSQPIPGLVSRGFGAITGTGAAAAVLTIAQNNERIEFAQQLNGEDDPASLVANLVAVKQKQESLAWEFNFDNYTQTDWLVPAAWNPVDWPDGDDINDGINDGVTVIGSTSSGSYIAYSATTRSKDASGTVDDPRALEPHRMSIMDGFMLTWQLRDKLTYPNAQLKPDELLPDGTINHNQVLTGNTTTPSNYRPFVIGLLNEFAGLFKNMPAIKESLVVKIDPNNAGRLECGADFQTIDQRHQVTFRAAEVSTG